MDVNNENIKASIVQNHSLTLCLCLQVLTVKSSELEVGSAITLENWQDQSNQKWLAVEAGT